MKNRKREPIPEMRLSLTSMLDLVFNILAFFVMTYRPPSAVKDYELSLPPPKESGTAEAESFSLEAPELFTDILVELESTADGRLSAILVENRPVPLATKSALQTGLVGEIRRLSERVGGIDAVNIAAPSQLRYSYLMSAVEACQAAGIRKINFPGPPANTTPQ